MVSHRSGSGQDQVRLRSVSGLEALLTHFVVQSEPEILRLCCKLCKVCEWEEKFLKELQGIREPMLDLDHTYQFFKRTISGKLLLCLDKGALTP